MDKCILHSSHSRTAMPLPEHFHMHTHADYEIYCFLSGDADYAVEGNIYRLRRGDMMIMRRCESHCAMLRSISEYERMTLNFNPDSLKPFGLTSSSFAAFEERPLGVFNHYSAALFPGSRRAYYLNRICQLNGEPMRQLSYLLPLIDELSEDFERVKSSGEQPKNRGAEIVSYIGEHLCEPLSLEDICETFHTSKSQLNRIFKYATGSTVWKYITVKRLFKARELLRLGENPTSVYLKCGFGDYTAFYRAYKNQFGINPKSDITYQK